MSDTSNVVNPAPQPGAPLPPADTAAEGTDAAIAADTSVPTVVAPAAVAAPTEVGTGASDVVSDPTPITPVIPGTTTPDPNATPVVPPAPSESLNATAGSDATVKTDTPASDIPDDTAAVAAAAAANAPVVGTPGVNVAPLDPSIKAEVDAEVATDVAADLASTDQDGNAVEGPTVTEAVATPAPAPSVTTTAEGDVVDLPVESQAAPPAPVTMTGVTNVVNGFLNPDGTITLVHSDGTCTKGTVQTDA